MAELDVRVKALLAEGREHEAVTEIVRALAPRMLGYVNGVLLDRDAAQEVWAAACLQLWSSIEGFEGRSAIETWVYTVVRSALATWLRAPARRRERLVRELEPVVEQRSPTPVWKSTPVRDAARALREKLTPEERELLILRIDRRLSWRTLAEIEHPGADEAALRRAEASLRKRFERLKTKLGELARREGLLE